MTYKVPGMCYSLVLRPARNKCSYPHYLPGAPTNRYQTVECRTMRHNPREPPDMSQHIRLLWASISLLLLPFARPPIGRNGLCFSPTLIDVGEAVENDVGAGVGTDRTLAVEIDAGARVGASIAAAVGVCVTGRDLNAATSSCARGIGGETILARDIDAHGSGLGFRVGAPLG